MADVSHSGHTSHIANPNIGSLGVDSRKLGVWAFIGSETLFFASLITTYLVLAPVNAARADFQDPKQFLDIELTTLLAAILLASSLTMVLALAAVRRGDMRLFRVWLMSTIGLGFCFLGGQVYEFQHLYHEGVTLSSSLFGTTFFVLTGFHGTHVLIGAIWLLAVFLKVRKYPDSPENVLDVELGGLYWHFVDLVWVAIFTLIYLI
ncbi:MAG TPA: cytochrome c oxidase subunit 3 [Roseiflexaceae bacterium]|nr:cytochrome c oxidase subunit 3 [Roseiflexaceae bacterium]HMP39538.1 cytochrome c oxidase subunit 3 [Roseiflexaceae bacterium]